MSTSIRSIVLCRHCKYDPETGSLTPEGVVQAEALAQRIRSVICPDPREIKLIVTPKIRTWETASPIAKLLRIQEIRSTSEEVTQYKELAKMLTTQWPGTEEYPKWSTSILIGHQGDLERLPNRIGEILETSFDAYKETTYGFAVLIDTQAKTCKII